jgi:hypothetical protein
MTAQSQKTQEPLHHAIGGVDHVRRSCPLESSLGLVARNAAIGILTKDAGYGAVIGHFARKVQSPCPRPDSLVGIYPGRYQPPGGDPQSSSHSPTRRAATS